VNKTPMTQDEYMALAGHKQCLQDNADGCPGAHRRVSNSPAYRDAYDSTAVSLQAPENNHLQRHTECTTQPDPIVTELSRALSRYEALCSPPRHLQFPLIGDLAALDRAITRALDRGDEQTSLELSELRAAELLRRDRLRDWQRGVCDRSADAWAAIECRLYNAIQDAVTAGALTGQRLIGCRDRQLDAGARRESARRREPVIHVYP
jgi:hypothetical protein